MEAEEFKKKIDGYLVPEIGSVSRGIRGSIAITAGLATSLLAAYAGGQAASHSPEIADGVGAVLSKMGHGIGETISDMRLLISTIIEHPEYITGISQETVSRDVINAGTRVYEYLQKDANAAIGNLVRTPIETLISSFGLAGLIRGTLDLLLKIVTHQDSPDTDQKIRSKIINGLRSRNKSRRISIPRIGGDTFTRK